MTGCPCGCATPDECVTRKPILPVEDWPDYTAIACLHLGYCTLYRCGAVA